MKNKFLFAIIVLVSFASVFTSCKDDDDNPPVVDFKIDKYAILLGDSFNLQSNVTNKDGASFQWTVNGEILSNEENFTFTPTEGGLYTVNLKVTNGDGQDSKEYKLTVDDYSFGTYFVVEGAFSGGNGQLAFISRNGIFADSVYYKVNKKHMGNILQDMDIYNGKIYLVSQNGAKEGGQGKIVVADSKTLAFDKVISSPELDDASFWAQHIVVVNENKAYVQYTDTYEQNSGIKVLDLSTGSLASDPIAGTFGKFGVEGASKLRMLDTDDFVYAACGEKLVKINKSTDELEASLNFGNQIKGVTKDKDGKIKLILAGEYTGSITDFNTPATLISNPGVVFVNENLSVSKDLDLGNDIDFSVMAWNPSIGLTYSPSLTNLYFWNEGSVYSYDYSAERLDKIVNIADEEDLDGYVLSGYLGATEDVLYIGAVGDAYSKTKIFGYNIKEGGRLSLANLGYDRDKDGKIDNYYYLGTGPLSGVYFTRDF
ncbi:MAG: PKD domain-containing protein [Marinifilaceae bacterium]|jgi:PKD repeat protein|nr:PKD domain-containing protein [Marinifilaceae bacterium]